MIRTDSDLAELDFLHAKEVAALASAGLTTPRALLDHFPRRYEDRRRFDAFPAEAGGGPVCIRARVIDTRNRFGSRVRFYEAIVSDASNRPAMGPATVTCRWFNMPYLKNVLAAGQLVILYGKPKTFQGRLVIDHPEFEVIDEDDPDRHSVHLERIVPVYPNVSGLPQRRLREIQYQIVTQVDPNDLQPGFDVDTDHPRALAMRQMHFPETLEEPSVARRRFALEEFFAIQLNVSWRRRRLKQSAGRVLGKKTSLLTEFYRRLPFDLTGAQKRSIHEMAQDMRSPQPMNRLLQGDVGSGKTFVAMAAMLLAVDSGVQTALMAPTQILAEQHYLTFRQWLEPLGIHVALRTADRDESTHADSANPASIIIGTHALLYDASLFSELGLIVIDEQHKFGVMQRSRLIAHGVQPDVIVMTATPIPRTLTMTLYGDLDVSVLDERPAGRGKLVTALRINPKITDLKEFVIEQLDAGRQAYLIFPLVDESDSIKAEAATTAFEKWQKRLKHYRVGLLHGKLDATEKESVMAQFRAHEIDVLVATSVVEVGVDVPNANLMIIHHAERFGLAQLHQLRGRIGRGEHKSYCVLLTDGKSDEAMDKLAVMTRSSDGFEIAEEDLRLRGPGEVFGTIQSGRSGLRFAELLADPTLLRRARVLADEVLDRDPDLTTQHASLMPLIHEPSEPSNISS